MITLSNQPFKARLLKASILFCFFFVSIIPLNAQSSIRQDILLSNNWRSVAHDQRRSFPGFENENFNDKAWTPVQVPHNWDAYEGYRRLKHGNRHGYAWYRKSFSVQKADASKRYFLWFEGVGSYATVWLNGKQVGHHKGGRTSFTIDVTDVIQFSGANTLAVRADHPAMINDLPWVCGGCSEDRGFSEGSQPLGIFRPVHLIITNDTRVEPFGVHIWNDEKISPQQALLNIKTTAKNYSKKGKTITVISRLVDAAKRVIVEKKSSENISANTAIEVLHKAEVATPHLWSLEDPHLYTLVTEVREGTKLVDQITTHYGIRWISWPIGKSNTSKQFFLNGKPVFINGTCEYEHMLGQSHAFTPEQIAARVSQIHSAGFNAFRDAHQPHNLLYQKFWDELGILWWPQFSAHAWFDNAEFKANVKTLLKEWIIERRNSPSIILWGLQNESKIPEDFARECTELIRSLDPTAAAQRLVTTCNGGEGTDWDVPQNWTGTYGGNPATYAEDLKRQVLVGEYGAWRSLDLHTENAFQKSNVYSEERMTALMEMKVRLAESVKNEVCGHFHWLFNSHDNPGRTQGGEGFRELDRIGPVNYKGLFTPWGEPADAYYMFRSNYVSKDKQPMVYIASHTWPDRWTSPGKKDSIIVYSNCDEVELYNDVQEESLGVKKRNGIGTHFQWDAANIRYNVLYAEGRIKGKTVARDYIILNHLPEAAGKTNLIKDPKPITQPANGYNYIYRVNCGGPDYKDSEGTLWMADRARKNKGSWGSVSWTNAFDSLPDFYASQRRTNDLVDGTKDAALFQDFRYGLNQLRYEFPLPDGEYLVELYFVEPWYGRGGSIAANGWRIFDVAINGKTVIKNLDVFKEVGHNYALKKTIKVKAGGGMLVVHFPNVAAGQAIISAIAIAAKEKIKAAPADNLITNFTPIDAAAKDWQLKTWLTRGQPQYIGGNVAFSNLSPELYGADWIQTKRARNTGGTLANFSVSRNADVFIALDSQSAKPEWMNDYADAKKLIATADGHVLKLYTKRVAKGSVVLLQGNGSEPMYSVFVTPVSFLEPAYDLKPTIKYEAETAKIAGATVPNELYKERKYVRIDHPTGDSISWSFNLGVADKYAVRFKYINHTGKPILMMMKLLAADGTLMKGERVEFPATGEKWAIVDNSTGTMINAGSYQIILSSIGEEGLGIDGIEIQ